MLQPGTGKTTTLVELVRQAVCEHGYKVLVTAPSNVAVDNVLSRLIAAADDTDSSTTRRQQRKNERNHTSTNNNNRGPRQRRRLQLVRLGHPARLQPAILPYCLEALVQSADGADIVKDVRDELEGHFATLNNNNHATSRSSHSNSNNSGSQKQRQQNKRLAYSEVKAMRKELRVREEKAVADVLERANVVLSTCVGAGNAKLLESLSFDLVVIDEAAQALEAACWIPALQARSKLVLAGGMHE